MTYWGGGNGHNGKALKGGRRLLGGHPLVTGTVPSSRSGEPNAPIRWAGSIVMDADSENVKHWKDHLLDSLYTIRYIGCIYVKMRDA